LDFSFSDEQQMLRAQARSFLAGESPSDRVSELAESDTGWDETTWIKMAELGWTGLSIPERCGGAGMGFLYEAVLFEELGYGLYPGPYFSTIGLALPAFKDHPGVLSSIAAGETRATVAGVFGPSSLRARGVDDDWHLDGEAELVSDLGAADCIVAAASTGEGTGLWLVAAGDGTIASLSTMDSTRRLGRLRLEDAAATLLAMPQEAEGRIASIRHRALAALSLEAVGVSQRVLELARDYSRERRQFDKPIGAFQAVSHKIADIYMDTELARSLAYWTAWCVAERDSRVDQAAAAAKAFSAEAAVTACERSIQVHGGVGFTWEHVLHRYYKRAQWIASFDGSPAEQRAAVARELIGT
jgi:alkylation response protein AidB-like acyl-CoA dehydrogenase